MRERVIMYCGQFRAKEIPKVFVEIGCQAIYSGRFIVFHGHECFFQFSFSDSALARFLCGVGECRNQGFEKCILCDRISVFGGVERLIKVTYLR